MWRRFEYLFRRKQFEQDMAEEMRLHLELRAAEEGDAAARRRFGNEALLKEHSRDAWGWTFLETLVQDLRYAVRTLNASRGFTTIAVLSLALGIGANTAIFSILNAVMLRSLPVEDPSRLVLLKSGTGGSYTNPLWEQIRDRQNAFSGALAYGSGRFDLAGGGVSHFTEGMFVSGAYFHVLGVPAIKGRIFNDEDDRHGPGKYGPVAVISYTFWKTHFAADPDVIGRVVHLNRYPFQVIGVTAPWFKGLELDHDYGVAIPIGCQAIMQADRNWLDARSTWWLKILARLPAAETIPQAQARLNGVAPAIYRATVPPDWDAAGKKEYLTSRFNLSPASTGFSSTGQQYRTALFILMTVVGLVLLIACANIANLLLARATARQREISVRLALGAGRARVIRQLMTESLLLSLAGAAGGLLFAMWGGRALVRLLSESGGELQLDLSLDLHLLAFTTLAAVLTGLLFGLAPAFRAASASPNQVLKESGRGTVTGSSRFNLGKALVIGQVALSLVLLIGAGLFLGTLRNLLGVDAGFDKHNLLIARVDVPQTGVPKARRVQLFDEVLERLRRVPGVTIAAKSDITPLSHTAWNQLIYPMGAHPKTEEDANVYLNRVTPGYFNTMGTPVLLGRDFSASDTLASPKVIVISQTTSKAFFGNASPIGKVLGMDRSDGTGTRDPLVVVGLVKDAKYESLSDTLKTAYLPSGQDADPRSGTNFEIRSGQSSEALMPAVRDAITGVNRDTSIEFRNFEAQVDDSMRQQTVVALLSAFFGGLALVLAMIGLYGVTAYSVVRRQAEIGIRMALGAQQRAVVWLVMRDVVTMLAFGTIAGIAASLALGKLVTSLLFGVKPNEPSALAAAAALLVLAAMVAAYLPARRASKLDPMLALRNE